MSVFVWLCVLGGPYLCVATIANGLLLLSLLLNLKKCLKVNKTQFKLKKIIMSNLLNWSPSWCGGLIIQRDGGDGSSVSTSPAACCSLLQPHWGKVVAMTCRYSQLFGSLPTCWPSPDFRLRGYQYFESVVYYCTKRYCVYVTTWEKHKDPEWLCLSRVLK